MQSLVLFHKDWFWLVLSVHNYKDVGCIWKLSYYIRLRIILIFPVRQVLKIYAKDFKTKVLQLSFCRFLVMLACNECRLKML